MADSTQNSGAALSVEVSPAYVGVGCNRVVHALAWGPSDLVAFGAHNAVAIHDPKSAKIVQMLPGHCDRVNCLAWLPRHAHLPQGMERPAEDVLLSGAADGGLIVWSCNRASGKWRRRLQLPAAHAGAVACVAALLLSRARGVAATCSADSTVRIWSIRLDMAAGAQAGEAAELQQTLSVGPRSIMQAVALAALGRGTGSAEGAAPLLLAAAGLDTHIHLYTAPSAHAPFLPTCQLKGHQDWVRSLDFSAPAPPSPRTLFLASASQDKNIRIWRISPKEPSGAEGTAGEVSRLGVYTSGPAFWGGGQAWQTALESLLVGHEDWVMGVRWQPPQRRGGGAGSAAEPEGRPAGASPGAPGPGGCEAVSGGGEASEGAWLVQPLRVLSASMDRSMMVWRPEQSGLWVNEVSVGEFGHSALGFYGGAWGPQGDAILAHGFGGSLHMWRNVRQAGGGGEAAAGPAPASQENGWHAPAAAGGEGGSSALESGGSLERHVAGRGRDADEEGGPGEWRPQGVPSGHAAPVLDLDWDRTGHFLLSASHDQTTRVVACWDWSKAGAAPGPPSWREIARPQVHGHDLHCAAFVGGPAQHRYASGAEEKVVRVFEAPGAFLDTLRNTVGEPAALGLGAGGADGGELRVLGANMSALGLSQKPIYAGAPPPPARPPSAEAGGGEPLEEVPQAEPAALRAPPLEEQLAQNTLWPEGHKLYGHGNELWAMAADHGGRCLATACKAQGAAVAEVWLWDVHTWRALGQLRAHALTVTQMAFSPDDRYLLCVSRDRHLSLFERAEDTNGGGPGYSLVVKQEAHKRIVWAAGWAPAGDVFATGSRDKTVRVWRVAGGGGGTQVRLEGTLPAAFRSSVTALAWAPQGGLRHGRVLLAVGMEDGGVELWGGGQLQGGEAQGGSGGGAGMAPGREGDGLGMGLTPALSQIAVFDPFVCHVAAVHRLRWRSGPPLELEGAASQTEASRDWGDGTAEGSRVGSKVHLQLASCGADHSVRLYNVALS